MKGTFTVSIGTTAGREGAAYAALPPDDANDYDAVEAAILWRYNINDDTYCQRFCGLKPTEGETPKRARRSATRSSQQVDQELFIARGAAGPSRKRAAL